jgi:3-methylcrotonyl-CoA carboxylase alpha subunit
MQDGKIVVDLADCRIHADVVRDGRELTIFVAGTAYRLDIEASQEVSDEEPGGRLTAPMPGNVIDVLVKPGDLVEPGRPLMIIEAMKMEHTIQAPSAGRVREIHFAPGDQVMEGDALLAFDTDEEASL